MPKTIRETGRGFSTSDTSGIVLTNSATETTLYSQDIPAGAMGTVKELNFKLLCALTTGLVPPNLTIRIKLGSSVLAVLNSQGLATSQSGLPFLVEGLIANNGAINAQSVYAKVTQYSNSVPLLIGPAGMALADFTEDTSVIKTFSITAQFASAASATSLTVKHATIELS